MIMMQQMGKGSEKYWTATGNGPLRPIAVEGDSRREARIEWHRIAWMQRDEREIMILEEET